MSKEMLRESLSVNATPQTREAIAQISPEVLEELALLIRQLDEMQQLGARVESHRNGAPTADEVLRYGDRLIAAQHRYQGTDVRMFWGLIRQFVNQPQQRNGMRVRRYVAQSSDCGCPS